VQAEGRKVAYARTIDLTPSAPVELITLSNRGEIEVTEQQQTGATGGVALSSQAVSELPLNKRDFSSLLLLAAGTMTDSNGATNFTHNLQSTGSAAWRPRSQWTEPTLATRRWEAPLFRISCGRG